MTVENVVQTSKLVVFTKNACQMVTALLESGYWVKTEQLDIDKVLITIRKDAENDNSK